MNFLILTPLIFFSTSISLFFLYKHKYFLINLTYISTFMLLIFSKYQSFVLGDYGRNIGIQHVLEYENKLILVFFFLLSFLTYTIFFLKKEKYFLMIFMILNGAIINFFLSRDYFNIYVSLELISMSLFLLVAFDREVKKVWASLKYMIFSSIALNFYLIAIAILYSNTGTLNLIENLSFEKPLFFHTFLITSLLIKSGVFFLSGWVLDVQTHSVPGISAILTGVVEKMGLWLIFLLYPTMNDGIKIYLTIFALITLFLSYLYLIFQKKIKKVFAVSTMSQVSYGLLIIIFSRDLFVYFFIYHMITKGIIFILIDKIFTEKNIIYIKNMKEKIIRYDTYLMMFILLFNLTGVYPSILYLLKKNIGYTLLLNSIIFLVGIFFGKIISHLHITEKAKKMNKIIIPLFSLVIIINLYLQSENIYESLIGFIFFIFGFVIFKIFKEESFEKDISLFDFNKNLYYIYAFVLISMIFELKGMI